jgi:hypothetical protein
MTSGKNHLLRVNTVSRQRKMREGHSIIPKRSGNPREKPDDFSGHARANLLYRAKIPGVS